MLGAISDRSSAKTRCIPARVAAPRVRWPVTAYTSEKVVHRVAKTAAIASRRTATARRGVRASNRAAIAVASSSVAQAISAKIDAENATTCARNRSLKDAPNT